MLLGWVLVATLEWAAWRGRPHYGSGLPPRYYVPRLNLPPALPSRPCRRASRRRARAEEQSRVGSPPRTDVLGDWPLAAPGSGGARREAPELDPWLVASLPVAPLERGTRASPSRPPSTWEEETEIAVATWSTVIAARARQGPMALHSLDPLAEPPRRKRGGGDEGLLRVDVPARPPGIRRCRPVPSRWQQ